MISNSLSNVLRCLTNINFFIYSIGKFINSKHIFNISILKMFVKTSLKFPCIFCLIVFGAALIVYY